VRSTLVVDTGVAYAAVDPSEPDHEACAALLRAAGTTITLPAPVVTETCLLSLSRGNPPAATAVLDSVTDGTVIVVDLDADDYRRVRLLVERYWDLPLDVVDASVVAIAERLEETTIATLDRRHFSVVRPLHCEAFTLVP
jgi:predicted nucleic acid-binding protein